MAQKKPGMHVEQIKAELRMKYGPLTSISEELGLHKNAISSALAKAGNSIATERRIATLLGKRPDEIWPDRYHEDGTPKSFSTSRKPTGSVREAMRQNGVAA